MDIRDVLPTIQVPTLVLHRRGDHMVSIELGATWPTTFQARSSSSSKASTP
jgi:hypothetical protein